MYLPTILSGEEYPNLLAPGQVIETIATSVLLVSFNWPENSERYRRTAKFIDAFFSRINEFHKPPRHPKWVESSINIKVPGWQQFKPASDWVAQRVSSDATAESFERFLSQKNITNISAAEKAALFRQYQEWRRTHPR